MAILILTPGEDAGELGAALSKLSPETDIRVWPETGPVEDIDFAIVWNHPAGELNSYPNLKVIASYGAGVDHLLKDPDLPAKATICRFVDPTLTQQMADYLTGVIFNHKLRLAQYREDQKAGVWNPQNPRQGTRVTVLGLGQLGRHAALHLQKLGFRVSGWSRSEKTIENIACYSTRRGLGNALEDADYLVNLLPLTPETQHMLDRELFALTKRGCYLINAGRGDHLKEADLMEAIAGEQLSGACLDVFAVEPLPESSPLWGHPRVVITPHIASVTNIHDLAAQHLANYRLMKAGKTVSNRVSRERGY